MATTAVTNDRLAEAEALLRRVLETQERTLGWEHPETLLSARELARVLVSNPDPPRPSQAEDREALRARRKAAFDKYFGLYAHGGPPYDPKSEDELYEGMP